MEKYLWSIQGGSQFSPLLPAKASHAMFIMLALSLVWIADSRGSWFFHLHKPMEELVPCTNEEQQLFNSSSRAGCTKVDWVYKSEHKDHVAPSSHVVFLADFFLGGGSRAGVLVGFFAPSSSFPAIRPCQVCKKNIWDLNKIVCVLFQSPLLIVLLQ